MSEIHLFLCSGLVRKSQGKLLACVFIHAHMCSKKKKKKKLKINFEEYDKIKIYISCLSLTPSPEFLKHLEFPE